MSFPCLVVSLLRNQLVVLPIGRGIYELKTPSSLLLATSVAAPWLASALLAPFCHCQLGGWHITPGQICLWEQGEALELRLVVFQPSSDRFNASGLFSKITEKNKQNDSILSTVGSVDELPLWVGFDIANLLSIACVPFSLLYCQLDLSVNLRQPEHVLITTQ